MREGVTDENKLKMLDNIDKQLEWRSRNNTNVYWNFQSGENASGSIMVLPSGDASVPAGLPAALPAEVNQLLRGLQIEK